MCFIFAWEALNQSARTAGAAGMHCCARRKPQP